MKKFVIIMSAIILAFVLSSTAFAAETDIGSAIWADRYATYTDDGNGVVTVYFDKEYVCGRCNPYEDVDLNGLGPAIWTCPIGTVTASNGTLRIFLGDGYVCTDCEHAKENIGSAIWTDEYATYTDDGSDVTMVYFDKEYSCGRCNPYEDVDLDGLGPAIWTCPIGFVTASNGTLRIYLGDRYVCANCVELA